MQRLFLTIVAAAAAVGFEVQAQPLGTAWTFQGELRVSGQPGAGPADLRLRLYDAVSGGSQIGAQVERTNVTLAQGRFTVEVDFGPAAFGANVRWVEIDVRSPAGSGSYVTLAPRQRVTAAPAAQYAASAGSAATATSATSATTATNATQLNGQPSTFYTNAANLTGTIPGGLLSGTYAGAVTFNHAGNVFAGSGAGLTGLSASNISTGLLNAAHLPTGGSWVLTSALSIDADTVFIDEFRNNVGFGTSTPDPLTRVHAVGASDGVWGVSTGAAGLAYGVWGRAASGAGAGVFGQNTSTTGDAVGVQGLSSSPNGRGVYGLANSAIGASFGVRGRSQGGSGTGVFGEATATSGSTHGVWGTAASTSGIGVRGDANATSGDVYGVFGTSASNSGRGVYGWASAASGFTYGVYGESGSPSGRGVYGLANATSGTNMGGLFLSTSPGGYGVRAENSTSGTGLYAQSMANDALVARTFLTGKSAVFGFTDTAGANGGYFNSSAATGTGRGVVGQCASGSGFGVYSVGNTGASGTKSFRIDHPEDPENRYLVHYSAESPEVLNIYSGTATLDESGQAWIALPAYFRVVNRDPRYTLTPVGAPMPMLHVAVKIDPQGETSRFLVSGGVSGAEVSWEVKALRDDAWVRAHGAPVEVEKQGAERGRYQHPELFGQPREKGMGYDASAHPTSLEPAPGR